MNNTRVTCGECGHLLYLHGPACKWGPSCHCPHFQVILTPAEMEVLKGLALGKSAKEIALDLKKAPKTIESQRSSLKARLGCSTALQVVLAGLKCGLLSPDMLPDFAYPVFAPEEKA